MCGRLSQYHGIHDFVDALSMPYPLRNSIGDQPLERYSFAPNDARFSAAAGRGLPARGSRAREIEAAQGQG